MTKPKNTVQCEEQLHSKILDIEHALEYSQKHFLFCSEQRMTTFRYFILYLVALSYGIYELYRHESVLNSYVLVLVIISFIISFVFYCLEGRNREIIDKSRDSCIMMESVLAEAVSQE